MVSKSRETGAAAPLRKPQSKVRKDPRGGKRAAAPLAATTKLAALLGLLRSPSGATLAQMTSLTGWQKHSVRGVMSGTIKKKLGVSIVSKKVGDVRVYRIGGKP